MTISRQPLQVLLPGLFLVSGASALIYQLVWMRQLSLLFGTTVYAISIVLAAFMAGLALGSLVLGRYVDRHPRPLQLYIILELLIGCYGLTTPWLFSQLDVIYGLLVTDASSLMMMNVSRFIMAFAVIVVGAALMGGTLPVMARAAIRQSSDSGQGIGLLYGLNTLGAVGGVALSGFWLIPGLGVQQTLYTAVVLNIFIAVSLLPWLRRDQAAPNEAPTALAAPPATMTSATWVLIVFAISGFLALAYEVVWTRVLSWVMGSSVYAFTIMLLTFLFGLALGSFIGRVMLRRWAGQARPLFAVLQLAIALLALLVIPLFGQLPEWFLALAKAAAPDFSHLLLTQILLAMLIMLPSCVMFGAVFPLACHLYGAEFPRLGRHIGRLYAANTLGAIVGSLAAGFLLVPLLGSATTLYILVLGNAVLGSVLLWQAGAGSVSIRSGVIAALGGIVALGMLLPGWNPLLMNSNFINQLKAVVQSQHKILDDYLKSDIVYQAEDASGQVLVYRDTETNMHLHVNGHAEGGTAAWDMKVQVPLAAIPGLMHVQPRQVLLVGLGPGITLGTLTQLPGIEHIDVVELSSAVVEASQHFAEHNHQALDDSRVSLIIDDARHYLAHNKKKYDLIIVGPSYTWVSGAANLFTREFLQMANEHLNIDGLMSIWFPVYAMTPELIQVFMQTILSVFPDSSGWLSGTFGELILIGSPSAQTISDQRLQLRLAQSGLLEELARANIHSAADLIGHYLLGQQDLEQYAANAAINEDNHPLLEFAVPRQVYAWDFTENLRSLFAPEREVNPPVTDFIVKQDDTTIYPSMALQSTLRGWQAQADYVLHYGFAETSRVPERSKSTPYRNSVPRLRLRRGLEQLEIRAVSYAGRDKMPDDMQFRHDMAVITGVPLDKINLTLMYQRPLYWAGEHQNEQSKFILSWFCPQNSQHYLARYVHHGQAQLAFKEVFSLISTQLHCLASAGANSEAKP